MLRMDGVELVEELLAFWMEEWGRLNATNYAIGRYAHHTNLKESWTRHGA
jgi:hypothetical protein